MTDKPTPKEIDDLVYELRQAGKDDAYSLASAVLAKWGQPAQAAEPVAWRVHPFDYSIGHEGVYAMTMREDQREAWRRKGWNTEPLFAAPQPVAREPLPKFLALKFHARRDKKAAVTLLFPGHEAADAWVRGIKGGQHVE